ncbi:hypothetical protein BH10PSE18_BH10PSE18_50580 [soil metagenome]|jgi:hypothetical protein
MDHVTLQATATIAAAIVRQMGASRVMTPEVIAEAVHIAHTGLLLGIESIDKTGAARRDWSTGLVRTVDSKA